MAAEELNGEVFTDEECSDCTERERSFDALTKGLASASVSRRGAFRLLAGALLGSALASIPGMGRIAGDSGEAQAAAPGGSTCSNQGQSCKAQKCCQGLVCIGQSGNRVCCPKQLTCGSVCCATGQTCLANNVCSGCPNGEIPCPTPNDPTGSCVNVQTNVNHCGVCGHQCAQGEGCCGGACTPLNTLANCGSCGNVCTTNVANAHPVCNSGTCGFECNAPFTKCGNQCVNTATDLQNCGNCNNVCPTPANATATCVAGQCGFTCNAPFANCDGNANNGCETNTNTDTNNCGACGVACPSVANATTTCVGGVCGFECNAPFTKCGNQCVNTATDLQNCGNCGNVCPARTNATTTCIGGNCGFTCNAPFANCDNNDANGCETNTNTDTNNCGACGVACPSVANATTTCVGGMCGFECNPGFTRCSNQCVNTATDLQHCGSCNNVCPTPDNATATCAAGTCGFVCNAPFANCDNNDANGCETNTNTDTNNCGACGVACPSVANATTTCVGGVCGFECNAPFTKCGNQCVNTATDVQNCGSCNNVCPARTNATTTCVGGNCGFTCNAPFANCDGNANNGCETNTNTDTNNCGACGVACPSVANATTTCVGGVCGFTCNPGFTRCNNQCVNTQTNVNNCGSCGNVCPAGTGATATCTGGVCGGTCTSRTFCTTGTNRGRCCNNCNNASTCL